jgi:hypothetical protein
VIPQKQENVSVIYTPASHPFSIGTKSHHDRKLKD